MRWCPPDLLDSQRFGPKGNRLEEVRRTLVDIDDYHASAFQHGLDGI